MQPLNDMSEIRAIVARLDSYCRRLVSEGAELAYKGHHCALEIDHILLVMLSSENQDLIARLVHAGLDVVTARKQLQRVLADADASHELPPALSVQLVDVLRDAWLMVSLKNKDGLVDAPAVIAATVANKALYEPLCERAPAWRGFSSERFFSVEVDAGEVMPKIQESGARLGSALARFTVDLNAQVMAGAMDPVVGREREIAQLIEILLRRRQNNPILTGEAGVGKTALVEGLAQRICAGLVPEALKNVVIHSLDMGLLKAGAGVRGEMESRLKELIAEIATSVRPIILFIDEAHTLVGGGGAAGEHNDIANLVKPELARGSLRTIAATTWAEYKRFFEKDAALSRRFQVVKVAEPEPEEAKKILQGLIPALQKHHGVYILQSAVAAAVDLSSRYIQGRQLPDKAISVLDTACARAVSALSGPTADAVSLQQQEELLRARLMATEREARWGDATVEEVANLRAQLAVVASALETAVEVAKKDGMSSVSGKGPKRLLKKEGEAGEDPLEAAAAARVGPLEVASVIADWTGVPSQQMLANQCETVQALEEVLSRRVVGQPHAVEVICNRIQAYAARLDDPSRPIGVFMLTGPSGVGKTETAHALAEAFFGGDQNITVVNMSEYQEAHTVSKLKGAPAGYVGYGNGGVLTEAIRRRPYGLLLLDEIEKAHPDVLDLFLQVFDKGFMEDSEGIKVDFKNTLIILTTNAGSELFDQFDSERDSAGDGRREFERRLHHQLTEHFRAAFLGRVHVVSFMPLCTAQLQQIVAMKLDIVRQRFNAAYGANVEFSRELTDLIVIRCRNNAVGARLIDQFVAENVLSRLSAYVLGCMAARSPINAVRVAVQNEDLVLQHD